MAYDLRTKHHNFYDMASLLQKAIRRGDFEKAGYAANELIEKYRSYLWKRLLIISAEDCYGIMTKEIIALQDADQRIGGKDNIFVAKAIMLLSLALKNRDACYFACNFMNSNDVLPEDQIPHVPLEECELLEIPDYTFDCHTYKGKSMGRTIGKMITDEQKALEPKQMSFFDDEPWTKFLKRNR